MDPRNFSCGGEICSTCSSANVTHMADSAAARPRRHSCWQSHALHVLHVLHVVNVQLLESDENGRGARRMPPAWKSSLSSLEDDASRATARALRLWRGPAGPGKVRARRGPTLGELPVPVPTRRPAILPLRRVVGSKV